MFDHQWETIVPIIKTIDVKAYSDNRLVEVGSLPSRLRCIGRGTDAAVFIHEQHPGFVFKVYADGKEQTQKNEEEAYRKLNNHPYFSAFYGSGDGCIVISYEPGPNLYECLTSGVFIPPRVIEQVDEAIAYAKEQGLNPRDIHLKNIIMQPHSIKLIDLSEYVLPGNDKRWEHLKEAYQKYYPFLKSRKIPEEILDYIKAYYEQNPTPHLPASLFKRILSLFSGKREG
ncbi:serine/threonine protein kinase [Bacillus xiapuensis]|uniref:serine/threonine protein kinase n=1 Tax=Bacillus xiapuensis TaxID=2014075 RepID=UPI000C232AA5|nr:serine/threonine protein kinase [Bacillus xiapuensis]